MRKLWAALALAAVASSSASAQGRMGGMKMDKDPTHKVKQDGPIPAGWSIRTDNATDDKNDLWFRTMGDGLHVTTGPHAIFWNPANTASGTYTVSATFVQEKKPMHPEAYGVFWGGGDLNGPHESYVYYIIRGDGKYMLKHRSGTDNSADVHTLAAWTDSPALVKEDASGKATNSIEARVAADSVRLFANGKRVAAFASTGMLAQTSGVYGFRINHNLDVHISGFGKK